MTSARINRAIKHLNLKIVRGCLRPYFVDLDTEKQIGEIVGVRYFKDWPLDKWVAAADLAVGQGPYRKAHRILPLGLSSLPDIPKAGDRQGNHVPGRLASQNEMVVDREEFGPGLEAAMMTVKDAEDDQRQAVQHAAYAIRELIREQLLALRKTNRGMSLLDHVRIMDNVRALQAVAIYSR